MRSLYSTTSAVSRRFFRAGTSNEALLRYKSRQDILVKYKCGKMFTIRIIKAVGGADLP